LNGPLSFFTDALGSTLALTSSAGVTVASYTYDPFGGTTVSGGSANPNQYTGRENDGTGLYYYRARYYNPRIGRFISEDPLGLNGGTKLYAYAGNDPVDLRDPTGQNPMCVASGLAFMSIHNIGIIGKTLSGRKIDYYSGWSGLGHIATEDATAFLTGCLGGVVLEAALPAAAVLPTATGVATAATAASTILQNQANGQAFEDTVIDVIGATKNTMSITVEGLGTSIPDVIDAAGNIIEIKNAINLSYTTQLQIQVQGAQGSVSLIVSPITQYISGPLRDAIARTGGTIQVFNPATGAFTPWH
jgi:RHS repeat-associated protein